MDEEELCQIARDQALTAALKALIAIIERRDGKNSTLRRDLWGAAIDHVTTLDLGDHTAEDDEFIRHKILDVVRDEIIKPRPPKLRP